MGRRHPNHRLVKQLRTYTVKELAVLLARDKNTIRSWEKQGLSPIDGGRPKVFSGAAVVRFLVERREGAKRPCEPGELYCLPCHKPQRPALDMVDFVPLTETTGDLQGLCPTCGRMMFRRVNHARLASAAGDLDVAFPEEEQRLIDGADRSVKRDFDRGEDRP